MTSRPTRLKYFTSAAYILVVVITLSGCATVGLGSRHVDFTAGFTTPEGNRIAIRAAHFDDTWGGPVGLVSCCWDDTGKLVSGIGRPLPRKAYIQWYQRQEDVVYEATLHLPRDLGRLARQMPEYEIIPSGRKDKHIYLVFGMKPDGQIEAWLTNAGSDRNTGGRVRHVLAQAQGTVVDESDDKTDK